MQGLSSGFLDILPMLFALMPHGYCFLWNTVLTLLHALSDGAIAIAYFSIPSMMYLHRKHADQQTQPLIMMFAMFILACGFGHAFSVWNIWHGNYWVEGLWKAITAVVSLMTAWKLRQMLPSMMGIYSQLTETALLTMTDPLTGIKNRHGLEEAFKKLTLSGLEEGENCFMLIDLDYFKCINDTHGHVTGDLVLVKVAELLKQQTRTADTVARIGGDEFAVLLLECPLYEGRLIAERIRQSIMQIEIREIYPPGNSAAVTASIGIVPASRQSSYEEVYRSADRLLYNSKNLGRNRITYDTSDLEPGQPVKV